MQDGNKNEPGNVVEPSQRQTTPAHASDESKTEVNNLPTETSKDQPTNWQFESDTQAPNGTQQAAQSNTSEVSWTASEYIAHEKAPGWYGLLALGGIALAIFIYLFTKDIISPVVIVIITILFGVFASRKPRVLNYSLDQVGVHIGNKFYPYGDFKSFSVMEEDGINAVWLMPLKRFMPSITMYYAPEDEEDITNELATYLPFEERDHDMIDRLMRKVKF